MERTMGLKDSKTEQNLKDAFAGESQANRRYLYFAAKADVEGYNDVAAVFRSTAEGETGHAHGHLETPLANHLLREIFHAHGCMETQLKAYHKAASALF